MRESNRKPETRQNLPMDEPYFNENCDKIVTKL